MKTAICDICKRTQEELAVKHMAYIRRFRMTTWHRFSYVHTGETDFDICDECLKKISELKGGGGDEG